VSRLPDSYFLTSLSSLVILFLLSALSHADGSIPKSLRGVKIPNTRGLVSGPDPIVINQKLAVVLGKSLFWDINAGSDGVACATCHFHAGADSRTRNQINPGQYHSIGRVRQNFDFTASGGDGGPDYILKSADFPLFRFQNPLDKASSTSFITDDVIGSAGAFKRKASSNSQGDLRSMVDDCGQAEETIFLKGGHQTRQTTDRNTPTVINAVFNYKNFWDGRANNIFNGETPWGLRDNRAGVWVIGQDGKAFKRRLNLRNASLASQAVSPPVNSVEMSCSGRKLADIARKLLNRRALEYQMVHSQDSVLAGLRDPSGMGLVVTYATLIRKVFASRYWRAGGLISDTGFTQMENNFPAFFGLAIQLYESTLISDRTPYDTPLGKDGYPAGLNASQKRGLNLFTSSLCSRCHGGPTFSLAAAPEVFAAKNRNGPQLVNRMVINGSVPGEPVMSGKGVTFALFDNGFANTGVVPSEWDPGQAGTDPFGNPLSFTQQYVERLLGADSAFVDPVKVYACDFEAPFLNDYHSSELVDDLGIQSGGKCRGDRLMSKLPKAAVVSQELAQPGMGRAFYAVDGAFKIPGLHNVELTGPYMHNGGMKSLEEVLEFYSRGGNVTNTAHFATLVFTQNFNSQQRSDLVEFLKGLTDERVRWERAPFDHPEIKIQEGSDDGFSEIGPGLARDRLITIPAVGRAGRTAEQGPLKSFSYIVDVRGNENN
jgi:cytochrome c peroxidase